MLKKNDFSETRCPYCAQQIPITQSGKIARHYGTFKKQPISSRDRGGSVKVLCKGSDIEARS